MTSATDPVLAPLEHTAFAWCSFESALDLLTWENNRLALKAACEFIAADGVRMTSHFVSRGKPESRKSAGFAERGQPLVNPAVGISWPIRR